MAKQANPIFVAMGKGIRVATFAGLALFSLAGGVALTAVTLNGNVAGRSAQVTWDYLKAMAS